jgi:hypothetical protein
MQPSRFKDLKFRGVEYLEDPPGVWVLHVSDSHALSQAAGYLKHVHAVDLREQIYFRGQCALHGTMSPSLFRGCSTPGTCSSRIASLSARIAAAEKANKMFRKLDSVFFEPLLQHYGFKTTWLDLVDNVWVALWFACHEAKTAGQHGEYLHFEERKADRWKNHVYVVLIGTDMLTKPQRIAGLTKESNTELVDLRVGAPSIFLRPHSQHGLLFRVRGNAAYRPGDYGSQIRGIIRANLDDAKRWLGNGALLSVHTLFPPPAYDTGYGYLLKSDLGHDSLVGGITHIGA